MHIGPLYGLKCEIMIHDIDKCLFSKIYNEPVKGKEIKELNELFNTTKDLHETNYYYYTTTDGRMFSWNYIQPQILKSLFKKNK